MARKASDEVCLENYGKLCEKFRENVPESSRFEIVYGCGVDVGMMDFGVLRKTTYSYSSYAIGFDAAENEIAVLPVTPDLSECGKPFYLKRDSIMKAKQSFFSKEITIRANSLPKKYIQFVVQEQINQDPDGVVLLVKQNEAAKRFAEFFKGYGK